MRGHNEPGGGFVAGLVLSVALLLQYIISGTHWVEAHMPLRLRRWIAMGLLTVLATGLASLAWGYPFLTSHTAHWSLPLIGEIHVPSAIFFDIGVFALVVGSTLMILTSIAHQSVRGHRHHARMAEDTPRGAGLVPPHRRPLMEIVLAIAIGVLTGSGVWLLLRPRTFQVIMGLALLSYAVNLFIFSMGRLGLSLGKAPVLVRPACRRAWRTMPTRCRRR